MRSENAQSPTATAERLSVLLDGAVTDRELLDLLTWEEITYLSENLDRLENVSLIWAAMDAEWETTGAGFEPNSEEAIVRFYNSPVWLLNGFFTEIDKESQDHRTAITDFITSQNPSLVADYGGGFGALSRKIATASPQIDVAIIEPFPSRLASRLGEKFPNLSHAPALPAGADIVVAQDVLEHVTDPLKLFGELLASVRVGGLVITANCFQPVIRCHYPDALHLHFTFSRIATACGCRFEGTIKGAPHAQIFRRTGRRADWPRVRILERLSKTAYPGLLTAQRAKRRLQRRLYT